MRNTIPLVQARNHNLAINMHVFCQHPTHVDIYCNARPRS